MSGTDGGGRTLLGVGAAILVVGLYIALLYLGAAWLLPRLPGWGIAVVAIIGALLFIMSPLTALKVYDRAVKRRQDKPGGS